MTIKYRKKDLQTGDYVFGGSGKDFYTGADAVTQAVTTRLALWRGTWWRDLDSGVPYIQSILGQSAGADRLDEISSLLEGHVLDTQGVEEVFNAGVVYNGDTRKLTFSADFRTLYGTSNLVIEVI